ncbi:MAG: TlpA family protein disulfide reductase [Marinilabiliaceae bacterium]|nr:TlpA family protein disulfide reductase [Marinilabiliaceae bacterium]
MKKSIFSLLLIVMSVVLMAQDNNFRIHGTIKGLDAKEMKAIITDPSHPNGYRRETIPVTNESFDFSSTIKEITHITISTGVERAVKKTATGWIPVKSSLLAVFVYPRADIKVHGEITDFVNAYPLGDEMNEGLAELNKTIYPLMNESANSTIKALKLEGQAKEEATKKSEMAYNKSLELKESYIASNPEQLAAVWMLSDMAMRNQLPMETIGELFSAFSSKYAHTSYYKALATRIKGYKHTWNGNVAPAIVSDRTLDKSVFKLSDLNGKYVVIDFWGTWCGPCKEGMPKMREYYLKYRDKLEMVSIAQDRNVEKWKQAVDELQMEWHNVINGKDEQDFVLKYNVSGFPTKLLIDPSGKILGRWVGEGEEGEGLYQKIDELL